MKLVEYIVELSYFIYQRVLNKNNLKSFNTVGKSSVGQSDINDERKLTYGYHFLFVLHDDVHIFLTFYRYNEFELREMYINV